MQKLLSIFFFISLSFLCLGFNYQKLSVASFEGEWNGKQSGFAGKYNIKFTTDGYFYMKRTYPNSEDSIGSVSSKLLYKAYPSGTNFKISIYPENKQVGNSDTLRAIIKLLQTNQGGKADKIEFNLLMQEPGPNDKIILTRLK